MKKYIWCLWLIFAIALAGYFGVVLFVKEDKNEFLIGDASHGHFQIEMSCDTCHSSAFGGQDVLQDACVTCHAKELEEAHDSHPKKKFTDPREAYRIEILDARYCVSCHTEHQEEQTRNMGVTLPDDYCYHCHEEVGEERESHKDLPFDSCASAGCHNFHDNRALYENFLAENANQPWIKEIAQISPPNFAKRKSKPSINLKRSVYQKQISLHPDIASHWQASSHAAGGVDCGGCHVEENTDGWIEKPGIEQCQNCHENEVKTYTEGKHGMRLAKTLKSDLSAMTTDQSGLEFGADSHGIEHGCNTCHAAHDFNTTSAGADACLNCHADEHSLAFNASSHATLWNKEIAGEIPEGQGVNCATCHMPSMKLGSGENAVMSVQHNQNWNLRPNEKMIRSVCMNCHSLEFSIDALADSELIKNNFSKKPGTHIESIDWALKRVKKD
ncbi:MAG: cytochrome c3 family protein [Agarilytica sp.]